jgi:hypothetical protein
MINQKTKTIMKTLSKKSAEKKLAKLVETKQINKTSLVYGWINDIINGYTKFRPAYSQGRNWKSSSLVDKSMEFANALRLMGIEFVSGNDAPKGGRAGVYIHITTKIKA